MMQAPVIAGEDTLEALDDFARQAGTRIVTLTGNGPPSKGDRIRQKLRFMPPHPEYQIHGQVFLSGGKAGTLMAFAPSNSSSPSRPKGALIQTITGCATNEYGVDGDYTTFIEGKLLDIDPERAWRPYTPDSVAGRIARIGRLLKHGTVSQRFMTGDEPRAIIIDEYRKRHIAFTLLKGALLVNGCDDEQSILYTPPSPLTPLNIELIGIDGSLKPKFLQLVEAIATPEIKVGLNGSEFSVMQSCIHVTTADMNTAEKLKLTGDVLSIFDAWAWDPDVMEFSNTEPSQN